MTIRPTRTAALLAAALGATTLAFAPAPSQDAAPVTSTAETIAAATVIDGQPVTTVRGLADRTGFLPGESATDLVSWVRANRRLIEASGLSTVAATDACAPLSGTEAGVAMDCEEPEPGEEPEEEFSWTYVQAGTDLDGDGWDEVLEITSTYGPEGYSEVTTIRSGRDASELWNLASGDEGYGEDGAYEYSFVVTAPDLDGDGGQDLLRVAIGVAAEMSEGCTPLRCEMRDSFSETMTMTALRGSTGEELGATTLDFSLAYEDAVTRTGAGPADAAAYQGSFEVVGAMTGMDFVDLDRDGTHQLLVGTADISETMAAVYAGTYQDDEFNDVLLARDTTQVSSEVTLLDLVTDERTVVVDEDDVLAFPVGVTLDGRDALVVDRYPSDAAGFLYGCVFADAVGVYECGGTSTSVPTLDDAPTRTLLNGDLATVWTAAASPYSVFVSEAGGDLDGDGSDDLLDVVIDFDAWELATTMVAGASGAELWTAPVAGGIADDGDLLGVSFVYDGEYEPESYEMEILAIGRRFDGATGAAVAERELASVELFERDGLLQDGGIGVTAAHLDGGGVDLAAEASTYLLEETSREEYCYDEEYDGEVYEYCETWVEYDFLSSQAMVVGHDGATFAELFSRDLTSAWLGGFLDLDRDGRDELLIEEFDEETYEVATVAERTDGTQLWVFTSGFINGVLETPEGWWLLTHDWSSGATVARDGADLSERWSFGGWDGEGEGEYFYEMVSVVGFDRTR